MIRVFTEPTTQERGKQINLDYDPIHQCFINVIFVTS